MDPMQVVLLGGTIATVGTGVVKSFRKRPKGEIVEQVAIQEVVAMCAVCGGEADEFDEHRMRWVCDAHLSVQSRPPVQEVRQVRKPVPAQVQRPRVYIDPHDVETVRDERVLRQGSATRRSRQDDYEEYDDYDDYDDFEEEELCPHGRYLDEQCRSCYTAAQAVQRRPVRNLHPGPRRQPQPQPQPRQPQPQFNRELLEYACETVDQYPDVTDAEMAQVLGLRRVDDAYRYRAKALELLGLLYVPSKPKSSKRR